jgi:type II secretory pathway pseudopilin PulG
VNAAVDFVKRRGPPAQGWLLLGLGALGFCAALAFWQMREEQRQQREQQAQAQAEAAEQARRTAARPAAPSPDERRARQAMLELRRPWLPTLQAIEDATRDPVYLLGWAIDPASGRVQLDGEAASFDQALSYAQVLAGEPALAGAQLVSHEQVNDVQTGRSVVKFTVVAQWRTQ